MAFGDPLYSFKRAALGHVSGKPLCHSRWEEALVEACSLGVVDSVVSMAEPGQRGRLS